MNLDNCKAYELKDRQRLEDLDSEATLLFHKKSGAKLVVLENDDVNKVFYIGFRTTPTDSTGVAHIMEHTVLCGSRKFPVKDPFVALAQGSLNTFLNAMTYPDKTVYPVASCNDADFQNLMDVYLDAVFYPNIYREKKIFMQEGWHYEMEDKDAPLTINGVVYNEMKGAFSSPDNVLERLIFNSLFPDTTYACESGGDPDVIPTLSYEQYLEFHKRYYHPANSYIYLYGDMDMEEKLNWLDEEYLSAFDYREVDSEIAEQKPFDAPRIVNGEYSVTSGESERDNTYLSYNVVVGSALDPEKYLSFQILDYALCSAPGAPLKQALTDAGIGTEIYSVYDNGVYQPYFSVVAKNANPEQKEEFVRGIEDVLLRLVKEGIDKKALYAGHNYFEFKYREADFGSYPKGLMYGLQMFDSWLYDANRPFLHVEAGRVYALLKERIEEGYFENLIQSCILDNSHKSYVFVTPRAGWGVQRQEELTKKLADLKSSMTESSLAGIVETTRALKEYQETPDAPEALLKIPMLKREDLKREAEPFKNELIEQEGCGVLFHDVFTNRVSYVRLMFDISDIGQDEIFTLGVLKVVWGLMDTARHGYGDLFNEIYMYTGGIAPVISSYQNAVDQDRVRLQLECKGKTLYGQADRLLDYMEEMLLETDFGDKKRLQEILEETQSRMRSSLQGAGHIAALRRAASNYSKVSYVEEQLRGIAFYYNLQALLQDFEQRADALILDLQRLSRKICRKAGFMTDYTGTREGLSEIMKRIPAFAARLSDEPLVNPGCMSRETDVKRNLHSEGFKTAGQVQYVCRSGNYKESGLAYHGALCVLKNIMGYEYLWQQVRVKGGAYGCMTDFSKNGESYFVSYRDPNLARTVEVYKEASSYLQNFKADERTMTKYIIGAVSDKDIPLTPQQKGARSLGAYFTDYDFAMEQKERDELLDADEKTIQSFAAYADALMEQGYCCVIGGEKRIEENKEMFDNVKNLLA